MTYIPYDELENNQQEEQEVETETEWIMDRLTFKKSIILMIIIVIITLLFYFLVTDNKTTDVDKINQKWNLIVDLQKDLIQNKIKQEKVYSKMKDNAKEYRLLLSWENIIRQKILNNNKEINLLIKN